MLAQAIRSGATSRDFFGTAYGQSGDKLEGFQLGGGDCVFDDTLLLIQPEAARAYEQANRPASGSTGTSTESPEHQGGGVRDDGMDGGTTTTSGAKEEGGSTKPKPKSFHGTAEIPPTMAKMHLVQLAGEIVSLLCSDPNAAVRFVVEISAEFPDGATDKLKRDVSENARALGLKNADWE